MVSVQFNPFTPEVLSNPYPMYKQLRDAEPVHWSELLDMYVLTRYADCVGVLRDQGWSANRQNARNRFAEYFAQEQEQSPMGLAATMLTSDPPEHTRLRGLANKAFTPRVVEKMRPHIQEIVDDLLEAVEGRQFDLVHDLAYPLPVIVIAEMLGVPSSEREQFKRWSEDIVATLGTLQQDDVNQRGTTAAIAMAEYFQGVIAERRRAPQDDLLSGLIAAEEQGQVLSEDEMLATCILLLVAGNETTTNLLGNGMMALFRHPDQRAKLAANLDLIEPAVEEMLRYDGPVQGTGRVAMEDKDVAGFTVKEGQIAFTIVGAANRDPEAFPNPDTFDIGRSDNRQMAFGHGIHYCLGAPLARVETQIAVRALLQRMPALDVDESGVEWGGTFIIRGPKKLPVAY